MNRPSKSLTLVCVVLLAQFFLSSAQAQEPGVELTPASNNVTEDFIVNIEFTDDIDPASLTLDDLEVTNGTASDLTEVSGDFFTVLISPIALGDVTVLMPADSVTAAASGLSNTESVQITVEFGSNSLLAFTNGDLNTFVGTTTGIASGALGLSYDPDADSVLFNGGNTIRSSNEWVHVIIAKGFAYESGGGRDGEGGMGMDPGGHVARPRAALYFANDDKFTTGELDFSIDLLLEDDTDLNALTFLYEVYAWNDGQAGPALSWGGATENSPNYNLTNTGDAVAVLGPGAVPATSIESGVWETVALGTVDVGEGYDNYALRFGILGGTSGDEFGFDNVSVTEAGSTGASDIEISDIALSEEGAVTFTIISPAGSVDVYRSTDLTFADEPIAEDVEPGEFVDSDPPSGRAYYLLRPTGE